MGGQTTIIFETGSGIREYCLRIAGRMFSITKSTMNAVNPLTNIYFFAAGYGLK